MHVLAFGLLDRSLYRKPSQTGSYTKSFPSTSEASHELAPSLREANDMSKDDVSRKLEGYLEQCNHFDKDHRWVILWLHVQNSFFNKLTVGLFRFMAVSDMSNILQQGIRLEPGLEKRIGDCLVKLFDDKSVDVQVSLTNIYVVLGGRFAVHSSRTILKTIWENIVRLTFHSKNTFLSVNPSFKPCIFVVVA
jgi:hypothetical protein